MNRRKSLMLMIVGIISLVLITIGVTYAFFNYAKEGTTDNIITTSTITFLYTEIDKVGNGISIKDAYPISDTQGKMLSGTDEVFDFKITSTTPNTSSIPYEITARKNSDSTLDEEAVKLYLTKVTGTSEEEVLLSKYSDLGQTSKVSKDKYTEKTIYTGKVPADSKNYDQAFKLRMWVSSDTNFSPDENDNYPYNNKEFSITVNVYANAKVVTEEEVLDASRAEISSLSINREELTPVTDQDYDYEISLPEGTTSTTIDIETEGEYAEVKIERLDNLAYSSNIKRLSTKKTLDLNPGDNYFKVTVTSENKDKINEYIIKIKVDKSLTKINIFNKYFEVIEKTPNLNNSSNNTSDNDGLYMSNLTNFNGVEGTPTYYFRGDIENNYISFAGFTWRIIRINEDGTIRLIMQDGINDNSKYNYSNISTMYYTESYVKGILETWYKENIIDKGYSDMVAIGNYFCEQAKVKFSSYNSSDNAIMDIYTDYIPNFRCETDGNNKGVINNSIGLITYDELIYAGGYFEENNDSYFLYNNNSYWTMSPDGYYKDKGVIWIGEANGSVHDYFYNDSYILRPVINLKSEVLYTGEGTDESNWVVFGLMPESNPNISNLSINGITLTELDISDYNYQINLDVGTNEAVINVETENPNATVVIKQLSSEVIDNNIKNLSVSQKVDLSYGNNDFEIIVTSENKKYIKTYIVNIFVQPSCDELIGYTWEFDYKKQIEKFQTTCPGTYKLEVWGAQGGYALSETEGRGGYGGYSTGNVELEENTTLFVVVGGQGGSALTASDIVEGGYNGGGSGVGDGNTAWGAGGGATHISKSSGLLFEHKENNTIDNILIVAGAGGGGGHYKSYNTGGNAGGYIGNNGNGSGAGKGGTQLQGGADYNGSITSGFGFGAGSINIKSSGGGSGYYGGGIGYTSGSGAGGGSGYIGNSLLTGKVMYCYNCSANDEIETKTISTTTDVSEEAISKYAKIGNGYAKITYLSN